MQLHCIDCGIPFKIADADLEFYDKASPIIGGKKCELAPPTLCPDCRQQRRLARRNERTFYKATCAFSGKPVISMHAPEASFTVYHPEAWWSDGWDPLEYGQEFDFSRPFFAQFAELQANVPRASLFGKNNENSEYTNHTENSKNCYLCADTVGEDIYYSKWIIKCKDLCDCYQLENSERCYESQYTVGIHSSVYAFLCDNASNLAFCYDCEGCSDCLLCSHLRHKRFCILNEQLSEEEYKKRRAELDLGSHQMLQEALKRYDQMLQQTFHRAEVILNSEDCHGDFIYHCQNAADCFGVIESQDVAHCYEAGHQKDSQDVYESAFDGELQYETHGCNRGKRIIGCSVCYDVSSCCYCDTCHNSHDLFGCIGLRHQEYCILNKQYSKEEYESLVPKIIDHMQQTGEWGQFFPIEISPFAYNETTAMEYYPMQPEQIEQRGWRYKADLPYTTGRETLSWDQVADHIKDVPDSITDEIVACQQCQRDYRITPQELRLYRDLNIALPRQCPDCRHLARMAYTNPRRLHQRQCGKCGKQIQTTFAPERSEVVYCEECYLGEVY